MIPHHPHGSRTHFRRIRLRCRRHHGSTLLKVWSLRQTRRGSQSDIAATVAAGGYFFWHAAWQQKADAAGWPRWDKGGAGTGGAPGCAFAWDKMAELALPLPGSPLLGVHDGNNNPGQIVNFLRWLDGDEQATWSGNWQNHADDSGTCLVYQDVIRKEVGWAGIEMDSAWDRSAIRNLRDFVLAKPGRVANWSMAIIPDSEWSNSNRFVRAASGDFDHHFTNLANALAAQGLADPAIPVIFRPGYEWDAGWFPWGVGFNTTRAELFAEYFRRIVTAMRAAQPNAQWYFDWNPNHDAFGWASFILEPGWPGGDYVDFVGIDIYDHVDITCTNFQARWTPLLGQLNNALAFAQSKGKKLTLPEWGIWNVNCDPNEWGAGTDNPYFMERMHEWISANAEHIHYHIYFNEMARHRLHAGGNPLSAAKFRELFGPPGA